MSNARVDQLVRESFVQDTRHARVVQLVREAFVSLQGSNAAVQQLVREAIVQDKPNARCDGLYREVYCYESPHARVKQLVREAFVFLIPPTSGTMPIQYPLIIPSALGESKYDLTRFDAVGEFISEFTGNAEQQEWPDTHWELQLEWPSMTWAQFAAYEAFVGALHGKLGSFLWGPPLATSPRGSGGGSPILQGTNVSGQSSIVTAAWPDSESEVLQPGDYLQIGPLDLSITYVTISGGILTVATSSALVAQASKMEGVLASFSGVATATWLDGAQLTVTGVSTGGGLISLQFSTLPAGAPSSYSTTADTGTAALGPARLYQYVDAVPLVTDGSGNATFDIFPNLREAIGGTQITTINPQGTFRLAENRRTSSGDQKKTLMLKPLKCREAI